MNKYRAHFVGADGTWFPNVNPLLIERERIILNKHTRLRIDGPIEEGVLPGVYAVAAHYDGTHFSGSEGLPSGIRDRMEDGHQEGTTELILKLVRPIDMPIM